MARLTPEQKKWCKQYEKETGFEPTLNTDLPFEDFAWANIRWFEDWSTDAHLNIQQGLQEAIESSPEIMRKKG